MENILDKMSKKEFDKSLDAIKEEYDRICAQVSSLRDTLDEYNKDEELQKKEETIKYLQSHSLCTFEDKELLAMSDFIKNHRCKDNSHYPANSIQCCLTYAGLGIIKEIICPTCGAKEDITDYQAW